MKDLFATLSYKQLKKIINTYLKEYYGIPRKTKTELLAKDSSIHRRTLEEHLRKAENSIMSFIILLLQIMNKK